MNVFALIFFIAAVVLFVVAGAYKPAPSWLTNIGLALLTVGFIIEFGAKSHRSSSERTS